MQPEPEANADLRSFIDGRRFATVMTALPRRFTNRTGKVAPKHKRLARWPR
jgi:hypothetical protein